MITTQGEFTLNVLPSRIEINVFKNPDHSVDLQATTILANYQGTITLPDGTELPKGYPTVVVTAAEVVAQVPTLMPLLIQATDLFSHANPDRVIPQSELPPPAPPAPPEPVQEETPTEEPLPE